MRVSVISSTAGFAALEAEWQALLDQAVTDHPFLTHPWLFTWWQVYGRGHGLRLLVCRDADDRLCGLLPVHLVRRTGLFPVRTLKLLGGGVVTSDFLGAIVRRGDQAQVCAALLERLYADRDQWDLLELHDLDPANPLSGYLQDGYAGPLRFQRHPGHKPCPAIDLAGGWEDLLGRLTSNMRRKIRARRTRLGGAMALELVESDAGLTEAFADLVRLHADRRDAKGGGGLFADADFAAFHRQICHLFARQGWLQLAFLRYRQQRVACVYQYRYHGRIYYYQTGFDRALAGLSVGFVLLGLLIERACAEGLQSYEFLRGDEGYKFDWGAQRVRLLGDFGCSNNRLAASAWQEGQRACGALKRQARRHLPAPVIDLIQRLQRPVRTMDPEEGSL